MTDEHGTSLVPIGNSQAMQRKYDGPSALARSDEERRAVAQVMAQVSIAMDRPRDEVMAMDNLKLMCERPLFAESARYKFPRGKKQDPSGQWVDNFVTGASVQFAREAARLWGNIMVTQRVVAEDEDSVQIQVKAWDLQTNTSTEGEIKVRKEVYRKKEGYVKIFSDKYGQGDRERAMIEVQNRNAAKVERNVILKLIPAWFTEECMSQIELTLEQYYKKNLDQIIPKLVKAFADYNVSVADIERTLGHSLDKVDPPELAALREKFNGLMDGVSTKDELFPALDPVKSSVMGGEVKMRPGDPSTVDTHGKPEPATAPSTPEAPKKAGRPVGSKNKEKDAGEQAQGPTEKAPNPPLTPPFPSVQGQGTLTDGQTEMKLISFRDKWVDLAAKKGMDPDELLFMLYESGKFGEIKGWLDLKPEQLTAAGAFLIEALSGKGQ